MYTVRNWFVAAKLFLDIRNLVVIVSRLTGSFLWRAPYTLFTAALRVSRAVLRVSRAVLRVSRAVLRVSRAVLRVSRAVLRVSGAVVLCDRCGIPDVGGGSHPGN